MEKSIDLSGFCGTSKHYRHGLTSCLYTDGVHYFAEQARAYWFLDLVMSEWQELVQRRAFLTVNLLVSRKSAIIKVSDGNGSNVKNRHVKVTDPRW